MTEGADYKVKMIAALERQREEIDRALAVIRALPEDQQETSVSGTAAAPVTGGNGTSGLRPHMFFGMKAPEAVRAYLAAVKEPRTAAKIAADVVSYGWKTFSDSPPNIIRTALVRMAENGEVVQVKGKEWGLVSWFPGLSKGKKAPTEAKAGEKMGRANTDRGSAPKKHRSRYNEFLAEKMAQGMSMKDAAAAWRKERGG